MARTAVLGFPRIGAKRELKTALEDHWAGRSDESGLEAAAVAIRAENLKAGADAGIGVLPAGDFALYDHVLDTAELVGIVAERHGGPQSVGLDAHFSRVPRRRRHHPARADEVVRHQLPLPRARADRRAGLPATSGQVAGASREASELGVAARPVVLGPLSLLLLSKGAARAAGPAPGAHRGLRGAARTARPGGSERDPARRALPGARPQRRGARCVLRARLRAAVRRGPIGVCLATYFGELDEPTLLRRRGAAARRAACRPRACARASSTRCWPACLTAPDCPRA